VASIEETHSKLADHIRNNPEQSFKTISEKLHCSETTISAIARGHGINRKPRVTLDLSKLEVSNG
jgi:hypothetical protein